MALLMWRRARIGLAASLPAAIGRSFGSEPGSEGVAWLVWRRARFAGLRPRSLPAANGRSFGSELG